MLGSKTNSMNQIKFKGEAIDIKGKPLDVGSKAEDFTFVKEDLSEANFYDYKNSIKVIIAVPSLDTGVCQKETRRFNEELQQKKDVVGIVVSKDLPFAMKRFCSNEGIENVISASDFRYSDFSNEYNLEMVNGPLKGLLARVVYVVDKDNNITYAEFVNEITDEPDYTAAMSEVNSLINQ